MPVTHFRDGVPVINIRRKFLRDASGSVDMNVDGSVTPVEFKFTAPVEEDLLLFGVTISLMDFYVYPNEFGDMGELTNGVLFRVLDDQDQVVFDMCDGEPIVRNADFAAIDSGMFTTLAGAYASLLSVAWKAQEDSEPLILPAGWSISLMVRDDLTPLDYFRALVKGRLVTVAA